MPPCQRGAVQRTEGWERPRGCVSFRFRYHTPPSLRATSPILGEESFRFCSPSFLIAGLTRDLRDCGSEAAMRGGVPVGRNPCMGAHISILVPKVRQNLLPPLQGLFVFIRTRGCTPVCYPTPLQGLFVFIRTRGCTPVCYPTPLRGFTMSIVFNF